MDTHLIFALLAILCFLFGLVDGRATNVGFIFLTLLVAF